MAEQRNVRSNRWVFTRNNPDDEFTAKAKEFLESTRCVMAVVGREHFNLPPGEGTPHFQGYVVTDQSYYRSSMAVWLPGCYLDPALGGRKQNWLYCTKENDIWFEKGYHLSDEERAKDEKGFMHLYGQMKSMSPMQFEVEHPMFMFNHRKQVLETMIQFAQNKETFNGSLPNKNFWVWGKTGTGKTSWAYREGTNHHIYRKERTKWWDGYDVFMHDLIVIDEWPAATDNNGAISIGLCSYLKNWADRYPFIAEKKGSAVWVSPASYVLVVTSQYPIHDCFPNPEDVAALKRRFHQIEFRFPRNPETGREMSYLTNPGTGYGECFDEHGELIEQFVSIDWSVIGK